MSGVKGKSGVYTRTLQAKLNMSIAQKGLPSSFQKGHQINLGKKFPNRKKPPAFSATHRKKLSTSHLGQRGCWAGKKRPLKDLMLGVEKRRGIYHYNWRGGVTPIDKQVRNSLEMKIWRKSVFQRDNYTCQSCGVRGVELNADHELPSALYPDLRFEILNGRTLCVPCHKKIPKNNGVWKMPVYAS